MTTFHHRIHGGILYLCDSRDTLPNCYHVPRKGRTVVPQHASRKSLHGKIALVAGATRGAGRGIAVALGEAGATVYCTGRSSRKYRVNPRRPETIEETAELVTSAGGGHILVRGEHTSP